MSAALLLPILLALYAGVVWVALCGAIKAEDWFFYLGILVITLVTIFLF